VSLRSEDVKTPLIEIELAEEGLLPRLSHLLIYADRIEAKPVSLKGGPPKRAARTIQADDVREAASKPGRALESYLTLKLLDGKKVRWKWTKRSDVQGQPTRPEDAEAALRTMLGPKLSS
jgi:hypothetical protein